jgi:hypothetical protein
MSRERRRPNSRHLRGVTDAGGIFVLPNPLMSLSMKLIKRFAITVSSASSSAFHERTVSVSQKQLPGMACFGTFAEMSPARD